MRKTRLIFYLDGRYEQVNAQYFDTIIGNEV